MIHWSGDRHSELRVKKNATGKHRRCTDVEAIGVIRQMAERFSDEQIAATLNRLGLRTGADNTWNEARVRSAREYQQLPAFDPNHPRKDFVTLREAAQRLGLSLTIVRRLIAEKKLPASSGHNVCALADTGGSIGLRGGSDRSGEHQEWCSSPANSAARWATGTIFRDLARYSRMSQDRYGVAAPILLGSGISSSGPLFGGPVIAMLCFVVHRLGGSRKSAREVGASRLFCFNAGFSGSPNGVAPSTSRHRVRRRA